MKYSKILLLIPGLAALSLTSCVVPGPGGYAEPGISGAVAVNYGVYDTLPSHYVGDAYYYGGRYYSGGRYETGNYHDHGRVYTSRYQHNGRYFYGGRQEHHKGNGGGNWNDNGNGGRRNGNNPNYGEHSGNNGPSWQQNDSTRVRSPRPVRYN